jgi:hypothetical protein
MYAACRGRPPCLTAALVACPCSCNLFPDRLVSATVVNLYRRREENLLLRRWQANHMPRLSPQEAAAAKAATEAAAVAVVAELLAEEEQQAVQQQARAAAKRQRQKERQQQEQVQPASAEAAEGCQPGPAAAPRQEAGLQGMAAAHVAPNEAVAPFSSAALGREAATAAGSRGGEAAAEDDAKVEQLMRQLGLLPQRNGSAPPLAATYAAVLAPRPVGAVPREQAAQPQVASSPPPPGSSGRSSSSSAPASSGTANVEWGAGLPEELCCPLTLEPMVDPVMAACGNTFERAAIAGGWVAVCAAVMQHLGACQEHPGMGLLHVAAHGLYCDCHAMQPGSSSSRGQARRPARHSPARRSSIWRSQQIASRSA